MRLGSPRQGVIATMLGLVAPYKYLVRIEILSTHCQPYRVAFLAQRKPTLLYRLSGVPVFRNAVRLLIAKPTHDPPRITFLSPTAGPPGFLSGDR